MKTVEVVAAIIKNDKNEILCVQRNLNKFDYISKKFEFPGGKIEAGESKEDALKREIQEELVMDIQIEEFYLTVHHQYPDFNLIMHSFICSSQSSSPILKEHIDFKWLTTDELMQLNWAAADIPIVQKLISKL